MRVYHTVHPKGLTPFEAAKAWYLRVVQKLPWRAVKEQVRTAEGGQPRRFAVANAARCVDKQCRTATFRKTGAAACAYENCGRKQLLTQEQKAAIVAFVKK